MLDLSRMAKAVLLLLMAGVLVVVIYLRVSGKISPTELLQMLQDDRAVMPLFLALLYLVSPTLLLPTIYLTLLVGALWGPFWGVLIDITGSTAGSAISFLIARYGAREYVKEKLRGGRLDALLDRGGYAGWRLNAMLRLNPIFPSAAIGYFFGLGSVSLREFVISTFIFLIIPSSVVVGLGSSLTALFLNRGSHILLMSVAILGLCTLAWLVLARYGKSGGNNDTI